MDFFPLMLELAQFKCHFEFTLQRQVFKNHESSSISYKMVSIFTFMPAIKALNLMFHTTCSLIRVYYNAWKRDTLFEGNDLLTFNDSVQLFQCWGRVLSYPTPRGAVLPHISDGDARHKIQIKTVKGRSMWVWLKLKLTPKWDFCVVCVMAFFFKFLYAQDWAIPEWANIVTFHPKHPKGDQNLLFTPQSETMSIPITFMW